MSRTKWAPIRVIVVDDSPTARELLVHILQDAEGIEVIATGASGADAVRLTKRMHPDVVTMDVRMPDVDGLEATRQIMRECPTPIVIISGVVSREDMDLTFEAMRAGALTVVGKPALTDMEACEKIVQTVRLMSDVPVIHHWGRSALNASAAPAAALPVSNKISKEQRAIDVIGIAASTGGPAAVATVLGALPRDFPYPILVVQHVAQGFTGWLTEWLDGETSLQVGVAVQGDKLQPGTVLLAPNGYHMAVNKRMSIELSKEPPYKGLRPSANHLFQSLARVCGSRAMGIVLSGMGDDGAAGAEELHNKGGMIVAQSEASCVVFGMPREAILKDIVDRVLSPEEISAQLIQLANVVNSVVTTE